MTTEQTFYATGKRKTSAARVFLRPEGTGQIVINGRPIKDYIQTASGRVTVMSPLVLTDTKSKFDIYVTVKGGGNHRASGSHPPWYLQKSFGL